MLDLEDLRTFVEAATHGTFTAAATGLYTSQPSLSRRIARLERQVGGLLFDRSNRRSPRLAPLGEALLPYAKQLLAEHQRFVQVSHDYSHGRDGILTVALSDVSGSAAIPVIYRTVVRRMPGLRVKVLERSEGIGVRDAILEREAEVGLLAPAFMTSELDGVTFGLNEHLALGLPEFLGDTDEPIEWEELRRMPLLLPFPADQTRYPGSTALDVVHDRGAPGVLLAMAHAALGVALLNGLRHPRGLVARPVAISGAIQRTRLQLAWRRASLLSSGARQLIEDTRALAGDRPPSVLFEGGEPESTTWGPPARRRSKAVAPV